MSDIFFPSENLAAIDNVPVRNCGRYLRTIQVDDGPHPWMSGETLYVCIGHGENRFQKEPSGPGYMNELRGKDDA